jgi:hypothetical protein
MIYSVFDLPIRNIWHLAKFGISLLEIQDTLRDCAVCWTLFKRIRPVELEFYEFLGGLPGEPVESEPELVELFQSSLNVRLGSTEAAWVASGDGFKKTSKSGCSCAVNCMKLPQLSGLSQLMISQFIGARLKRGYTVSYTVIPIIPTAPYFVAACRPTKSNLRHVQLMSHRIRTWWRALKSRIRF